MAAFARSVAVNALTAAVALAGSAAGVSAETGIQVVMNQAKIVKLARPADTIVIGNPNIADASVQDATTVVLTGKGFGVTNLVNRATATAQYEGKACTVCWPPSPMHR